MVISVPGSDQRQRLQSGIGLLQQGRLEEAFGAFNAVALADPANALAFHLRGLVLMRAGQVEDGIDDVRYSITVNPNDAAAHGNLAAGLRDIGAYAEALDSCGRALALDPGLLDAALTQANVMLDLGRPAEALAGFDAILARQPHNPKALSNRGGALVALNRHDEGAQSYERAVVLEPGVPEIRVNAGFARLATGDYERGLALFEARWESQVLTRYLASRAFDRPFWRGDAPLAGKTLLLHSEQGFGDILQFCRYAPLAAERGARVVVEVDALLAALMTTLPGVAQVVIQGEPLPPFDLHCPMMSLPYAFRTTLQTIPGKTPYLFADPAKAVAWAQRLGPKARPSVGLVWSSGFRPDQPELRAINGRRNLPLEALAVFRDVPVDFISLQKGQPAEGAFNALDLSIWQGPPILNVGAELSDFSETAALIESLDLVVTVDTSVAHLTGALGRPVWVMNRFDPCWRWLAPRADSPWYPTARLFRQPQPGDWERVLAEVRDALGERFGS